MKNALYAQIDYLRTVLSHPQPAAGLQILYQAQLQHTIREINRQEKTNQEGDQGDRSLLKEGGATSHSSTV